MDKDIELLRDTSTYSNEELLNFHINLRRTLSVSAANYILIRGMYDKIIRTIENLIERDNKLSKLEAGGVDNWEGYEYSINGGVDFEYDDEDYHGFEGSDD